MYIYSNEEYTGSYILFLYIYMYIYIYTSVSLYIYVGIYTYVYICLCMYIYTYKERERERDRWERKRAMWSIRWMLCFYATKKEGRWAVKELNVKVLGLI